MIYLQVNQKIRIKADGEILELKPGQVVTVSDDQAQKLLDTGRAVQVKSHEPIPAFCRDCWAEGDCDCHEKIHTLPCTVAILSCPYLTPPSWPWGMDGYKTGQFLKTTGKNRRAGNEF